MGIFFSFLNSLMFILRNSTKGHIIVLKISVTQPLAKHFLPIYEVSLWDLSLFPKFSFPLIVVLLFLHKTRPLVPLLSSSAFTQAFSFAHTQSQSDLSFFHSFFFCLFFFRPEVYLNGSTKFPRSALPSPFQPYGYI